MLISAASLKDESLFKIFLHTSQGASAAGQRVAEMVLIHSDKTDRLVVFVPQNPRHHLEFEEIVVLTAISVISAYM